MKDKKFNIWSSLSLVVFCLIITTYLVNISGDFRNSIGVAGISWFGGLMLGGSLAALAAVKWGVRKPN